MKTAILHAIYAAIILAIIYAAYDYGRFCGGGGSVESKVNNRLVTGTEYKNG